MGNGFTGSGIPLDQAGISKTLQSLGVSAPEVWAILEVETHGCGFLQDRRPEILYERHIFSGRTTHQYDASHHDISNPHAGGYAGGAGEYVRLGQAIALNRVAALESASWGIGQVMGFNAKEVGYADAETMVQAMVRSENDQLDAFAGFIVHNGLDAALRDHRWADFARGYNGSNFAENQYDTRLHASYERFAGGGLPDINVRTAQVCLMYLGYNPHRIDGQPGRFTFAALNAYQASHGFPVVNAVDAAILEALRRDAGVLT